MRTLNQDEINLIRGALDSLGVAIADHDHQWTDGERAVYEEALKVLDGSPVEHGVNCQKVKHGSKEDIDLDGWLHDPDHDGPYWVDGGTYCGRCHQALG